MIVPDNTLSCAAAENWRSQSARSRVWSSSTCRRSPITTTSRLDWVKFERERAITERGGKPWQLLSPSALAKEWR